MTQEVSVFCGDALSVLRESFADQSVQCCVTSPPYWGLRDYGVDGQLGLEKMPDEYVEKMVAIFREVRRVLKDDGTLWLNLGDTYCNSDKWGGGGANTGKHSVDGNGKAPSWSGVRRKWGKIEGLKPKDLAGIPWMVAFALRADGWYLRADIIWHKPNAMPESVRDRPTKSHEYLFLLSKSERYFYDSAAIREPAKKGDAGSFFDAGKTAVHQLGRSQPTERRKAKALVGSHGTMGHDGNGMRMPEKWDNPAGRNKRSVWSVSTQPYPEAHFATFPTRLIEPCILAGSRPGDVVLDPFVGAGTTLLVAKQFSRRGLGIELNPAYIQLAQKRLAQGSFNFTNEVSA